MNSPQWSHRGHCGGYEELEFFVVRRGSFCTSPMEVHSFAVSAAFTEVHLLRFWFSLHWCASFGHVHRICCKGVSVLWLICKFVLAVGNWTVVARAVMSCPTCMREEPFASSTHSVLVVLEACGACVPPSNDVLGRAWTPAHSTSVWGAHETCLAIVPGDPHSLWGARETCLAIVPGDPQYLLQLVRYFVCCALRKHTSKSKAWGHATSTLPI
jgi:hypothetical protein